jgi:hypothetical protein
LCKHDRQDAYPTVCLNGIAVKRLRASQLDTRACRQSLKAEFGGLVAAPIAQR